MQPLFRAPLPRDPAAVRIVYWQYQFTSADESARHRAPGGGGRGLRPAAPYPARRSMTTAPTGTSTRTASLGTLFLTVFLDLLGFGLVIPFLPGMARATSAPATSSPRCRAPIYSVMQFLFIPIWGRLSDRIGRRPVLLWSIAASAVGMALLGLGADACRCSSARAGFSGVATANIAVAQAYIADVTPPEQRARGMGIIGIAFGLGFIFGPFIGGELSRLPDAADARGRCRRSSPPALSVRELRCSRCARSRNRCRPPRAATRCAGRSRIDLGAFRAAIARPRHRRRRRHQLRHGALVRRHGADVPAVHGRRIRDVRRRDRPGVRRGRRGWRDRSGRPRPAAGAAPSARRGWSGAASASRRWRSRCSALSPMLGTLGRAGALHRRRG